MVIAINTRMMLAGRLEGSSNFIYEIFTRLAKQHPAHTFIFIFDQPYDEALITNKNIIAVVAGPAAKYPLLWKYWYDIKIPSLLKKYKADIFVSADGFCSLKTRVPQCMIVHNLAYLQEPLYMKKSHAAWLKKSTPRFVQRANSIVATTAYLKQELIEQTGADHEKVTVVPHGINEECKPLATDEKIVIKHQYTEGKEYFVYAGAIDTDSNLVNLLKAFSVFKKRQQTSMKLVLVGNIATGYDSFKKNLQSYKYRNDVLLLEDIPVHEQVKLIAAAYAMLYPCTTETFAASTIAAMQSDVPVIAAETNSIKEIAKEAAILVDGNSHTAIADQMMMIYKDERLRNDLIIKGRKTAANYNWDTSAALVWKSVEKAIG